jgi:predicted metal-binding protein
MGAKHKVVKGEITRASGPWSEALLVCRKCSKKLGGGFGPDDDETLVRVLKQLLRDSKRRREVRVIEVGCLDICPKQAVVVIQGNAPGEMLIVPKGLQAQAVADRLLGCGLTPTGTTGS